MSTQPKTFADSKAILVTGGRGFIGRHLVRHLAASRRETIISADLSPITPHPLEADCRHVEIELDLRDRTKVKEVLSNFDLELIFDLASVAEVGLSKEDYAQNVEMTRSMIECVSAFRIPKYIFYSTQFVFRKENALPKNDADYFPIEAYGESKIRSELLIRTELPPEQWVILRPTYIWGEGNRRFRDGFLHRLARGQLMISTRADLLRYYGYAGTICKQTDKLSTLSFNQLPSSTLYLSDQPISMVRFCEYFLAALGVGRVWRASGGMIRMLGRIGDVLHGAGVPFPISGLQSDEMTRSYPVPIEATLAVTKTTTNYERAAAAVVRWALSDPEFSRRIRR